MEKEVAVTYETLFEFLRLEKGREQLQKLPDSFFEDVIEYLKEKQHILDSSSNKMDLFSSTEKDKVKVQIENVRRILKDFYERRERKIINLALVKSKTGSTAIDTSAMLPVEKQMFDSLVEFLDRYRDGILLNLFQNRFPEVDASFSGAQPAEALPDSLLLRFLKPVPQFVGKELESYGPFEPDDVAKIPLDIANLLIDKGHAEKME